METIPMQGPDGQTVRVPIEGLEGCPDFDMSGKHLRFRCGSGHFQEWGKLCWIEKHHATCVAFAYYEHLAHNIGPKGLSSLNGFAEIDRYKKAKKAASAWRAMQKWSA